MVLRKSQQLARVAKLLLEWQRKADRYARQAARSDADLQADRDRRAAAAARAAVRRRRRAIALAPEPGGMPMLPRAR
jgi:hypothetical protein